MNNTRDIVVTLILKVDIESSTEEVINCISVDTYDIVKDVVTVSAEIKDEE